jgi:hypothetical protein
MPKSLSKMTAAPSRPNAKLPKGFKAVAPPKNQHRRRLIESDNLTTSGGCRTVHRHSPVRH